MEVKKDAEQSRQELAEMMLREQVKQMSEQELNMLMFDTFSKRKEIEQLEAVVHDELDARYAGANPVWGGVFGEGI